MREIVKVLLQEGIDEETIHEVLNILEVSYDFAAGPWRKKKAIADELRKKAMKEGGEADRIKYEDALNDEIKHMAKLDSWFKGKPEREKKAKEKENKNVQQ